MKAAAYYRVSTEEQARRQTVETQRETVRQFAAREGIEIAREYVDAGVSGTIPLHERPAGREILRDAPERVLVYRLDRVGRDTLVTLSALKHLKEQGIQIESVSEDLSDVLLTEIKAAIGADEMRTIRKRSRAGMRRKAKEGGWLGGPVPYGYRAVGERGDATLRPCEADVVPGITEAGIVRMMFEMASDGRTSQEIADHLSALGTSPGMRPKDGTTRGIRSTGKATEWKAGRVARILNETIYKGQHVFKRWEDAPLGREPGDGKEPPCRWRYNGSKRTGVVVVAEEIEREFPALVPAHLWEAAQETLKDNRRGASAHATRDYLLRGKIVCESCGTVHVGATFTDNRGTRRSYYTAGHGRRGKNKFGDCVHKVIRVDEFEDAVWSDLLSILHDPEPMLERVRDMLGASVEGRSGLQEERADYRRRLSDMEGERDRMLTAFRKGLIDEAELARSTESHRKDRAALESYLADLEARIVSDSEAANRAHSVAALLERYRERLPNAPKRDIVDALVDRIDVRTWLDEDGEKRQRIEIVYRFEAAPSGPEPTLALLPQTRTRSWPRWSGARRR